LPGYVALQLQRAGCAGVTVTNACCYTLQADFFSYRRSRVRGEADYGRQISAIVLT
jgi:purine-nucleoside/S-methyl-5'-thioadenosine phosphorylase / adenosine deaminase